MLYLKYIVFSGSCISRFQNNNNKFSEYKRLHGINVGKYTIVPWILREYQGPAPFSVPETFEQWKNCSSLGYLGIILVNHDKDLY